MTLPAETAKRVSEALASQSLVDKATIAEVVKALGESKDVNWNLVLTKQFESEQGGTDGTES
tara:strand:- start:8318 stop:8503 length:186 start_codon:yes stop_codon:yes gene_type:complete